METIPLSQFLKGLRAELVKASLEGAGEAVRFVAEKVEVEMTIGAQKNEKIEGGVEFSVFGIGAKFGGEAAQQADTTQKMTLTLTPIDPKTGKSTLIAAAPSGNQQSGR